MKRLIALSVLSILLVNSSTAQITKGNWMVGGSGMFKKDKAKYTYDVQEYTAFELTPRIGYFFINKMAAGLEGLAIIYKMSDMTSTNRGSSYGVGPFIRYYFLPEDNRINVLAEANGGYFNLGTKTSRSKSLGYGFSAGTALFLNSSIAFELLMNYRKEIPQQQKDLLLYRSNLQFTIGLQVHLDRD